MAEDLPNLEQIAESARRYSMIMEDDPVIILERLYKLWWNWADFSLFIINPPIEVISPPIIINPENVGNNEYEFVYPIHDHGYKLVTSKAQDMFKAGMSMCKLFYTIEKIIFLLVERLKVQDIAPETEVQVAFGGHELPQRKAFESIINLKYNVIVTNFEPGSWGDRYLATIKRLADQGYGYPPETPREIYRQSRIASAGIKR